MKTNNLLLHICLVIFLIGAFTTIKAQNPVNEDDPALQAMEHIEKVVDKHLLLEEETLKFSSLSNEANQVAQVTQFAEQPVLLGNQTNNVENISRLKLSKNVLNNYQYYKETLVGILRQEGMPVGLLSVALVESGFHPFATSPKGAKGIWQFMPATARRYGLTVESNIDYRTDPTRSTKAAAQYLKALYQQFGDWKLALAAYNAGENRIQRIINKTKIYDFDELARRGFLPKETANYVPAVLSIWPQFGKPLLFSEPENTAKPFKQSNISTIIEASFKLGLPTLATSMPSNK